MPLSHLEIINTVSKTTCKRVGLPVPEKKSSVSRGLCHSVAFMFCALIIVSILDINIQCVLYGHFGLAL